MAIWQVNNLPESKPCVVLLQTEENDDCVAAINGRQQAGRYLQIFLKIWRGKTGNRY